MNSTHSHAAFKSGQGFTIVELLIVIVVIAILAAITIVSYNGITARARDTTVQSDLHNAVTLMGIDQTTNGSYATTLAGANNNKGLPASDGTVYSYHSDGSTFCITATSSYTGNSFYASNASPAPATGKCPQDLGSTVATLVSGLSGPTGLVADTSGNLYFTDASTSRIREVSTNGTLVSGFVTGWGPGYTEGTGTAAVFNWPQAITIGPSGYLYISDTNNYKIRELSPSVVSRLVVGSTQGDATTLNQFNVARGIVYSPQASALFVANSQSNQIKKVTTSGTVSFFAGQGSGGYLNGLGTAAKFNYPEGLAIDSSGNIYVADTQNHRIRVIDPSGNVNLIAGTGTAGSADGNATTTAQFKSPGALTVGSDGSIYVADTGNNSIRKISGGNVTTIAGTGTAGFADGSGASAQFSNPNGIAIGSDGKLYVSDTSNNRIRVITNF